MRRRPGTLHYLTQAIRNDSDLHSLAVPVKYRRLGDFHRYYSGEKVAPILTLVIGGNHEASNYFWELYVVPLTQILWRLDRAQHLLPWRCRLRRGRWPDHCGSIGNLQGE